MKKGKAKKVWHIFRFAQRFELSDDVRFCRKSPLLYTRDYVGSGQDDESISYQQQINTLRGRPDRLELRGAFHELKEIAANRSRCYRGYLLDEQFEPATDRKIALWLGQKLEAARAILAGLAEVGLIERVDLPRFDPEVNNDPAHTPPDTEKPRRRKPAKPAKSGKAGTAAKTAKPANGGRKTPAKGKTVKSAKTGKCEDRQLSRARTGKTTNSKGKINTKGNINRKEKSKGRGKTTDMPASGISKSLKEINKTAKGEKPCPPNHPAERGMPKGMPKGKDKPYLKLHAGQASVPTQNAEGQANLKASLPVNGKPCPPATPPTMPSLPTISDAGEAATSPQAAVQPPRSVLPTHAIVGRLEQLYDPNAQAFALAIYQAIRTPFPADSPEGRREMCNFAAAWSLAQTAGIPPSELTRLWDKSIKEANVLGNKRRRVVFTKSPEAVWRAIFNKRLEHLAPGSAIAARSRGPGMAV